MARGSLIRAVLLSAILSLGLVSPSYAFDRYLPGIQRVDIEHMSAVVHVVGMVMLRNQAGMPASFTGDSLNVNCTAGCTGSPGVTAQQGSAGDEAWPIVAHQAGVWTISHVSSVVHVSAATVGGLLVNCVAGCSGAPAGPTVVAHVSSVTHVSAAGAFPIQQGQAGSERWPVSAHQAGAWSVAANQQNTWSVFAHQASAWNVGHVSSATHIVGSVKLVAQDGTTVTLTGTSVNVNCTGGCGSAAEGQSYVANVFASTAGASKDHLSLFNASGSGKVIKIRKVKIAPEFAATVTGLAQAYRVSRTSSAGATCTGRTIVLVDTTNGAVPAQVTAATNCTTDPTVDADLLTCAISGDETHAMDPEGICYQFFANGGQPITLREGQGLMVKSSALSGAYPVSIAIEFTM